MKIHLLENNGTIINCEIKKRRNSKNLRMSVNSDGIVKVSIPYYTSYSFAKRFIHNNLDWIEQKINHFTLERNRYYYLGNNISIIKKYNANITYFNYIRKSMSLYVLTSDNSLSDYDLYIMFLKNMANEYIPRRVEEFAGKHGFKYNTVKIKNLSSSWGSCTNNKNLSFNLKLMYFNYKVIDYVIVHELCHLKVMNHSRKFWNLVENILPDYQKRKAELNK